MIMAVASLISIDAALSQQNKDVLQLSDKKAASLLQAMAANGKLSTPGHAGAWVVIASVSLGVGRDVCNLPEPGDTSFLVQPALDGMTIDQIMVLNRLVTANYRAAEGKRGLEVAKLYPITRQAVAFLGYRKGKFNCGRVGEVWSNALNYNRARN